MLDIKQKKKHLLLLNKILRSEVKNELIPVPSKLSEEEVNKYFDRLFVKKSEDGVDYYVPIKNKLEISIDEDLFKGLVKKKVTMKKSKIEPKKEAMKEEKPKKEPMKEKQMKEEKPMKEELMKDEEEEDIEFVQDPEKLSKTVREFLMSFVKESLKKFNDNYIIKFVNLRKENKLNDEAYYDLTRGYLNLSALSKYYALQKYKTLEGLVKPYIGKVKQMIIQRNKESEKNIKEMKRVRDIRKKEEEKKMRKDFKEEYKMEKEKLKQEAKDLKMK